MNDLVGDVAVNKQFAGAQADDLIGRNPGIGTADPEVARGLLLCQMGEKARLLALDLFLAQAGRFGEPVTEDDERPSLIADLVLRRGRRDLGGEVAPRDLLHGIGQAAQRARDAEHHEGTGTEADQKRDTGEAEDDPEAAVVRLARILGGLRGAVIVDLGGLGQAADDHVELGGRVVDQLAGGFVLVATTEAQHLLLGGDIGLPLAEECGPDLAFGRLGDQLLVGLHRVVDALQVGFDTAIEVGDHLLVGVDDVAGDGGAIARHLVFEVGDRLDRRQPVLGDLQSVPLHVLELPLGHPALEGQDRDQQSHDTDQRCLDGDAHVFLRNVMVDAHGRAASPSGRDRSADT